MEQLQSCQIPSIQKLLKQQMESFILRPLAPALSACLTVSKTVYPQHHNVLHERDAVSTFDVRSGLSSANVLTISRPETGTRKECAKCVASRADDRKGFHAEYSRRGMRCGFFGRGGFGGSAGERYVASHAGLGHGNSSRVTHSVQHE